MGRHKSLCLLSFMSGYVAKERKYRVDNWEQFIFTPVCRWKKTVPPAERKRLGESWGHYPVFLLCFNIVQLWREGGDNGV